MSRMFWILMIHVRRPSNWARFAGILACCLFVSLSRSGDYQYDVHGIQSDAVTSVFWPRRKIRSLHKLKTFLANPSNTPVAVDFGLLASDFEGIQLKMMEDGTARILDGFMDDSEAHIADVQLPENTHWLTTSSWKNTQATIDQISNFDSIKQLELHFVDDQQVPLDLAPLARLDNLERLELKHLSKVDSLSSLRRLRKLKTLIIGQHQLVTGDNLSVIASFESLRELYLPDISHNPIAMEAIKQLKASRSLDRVYVAVPPTERETLSTIAVSVGNIDLRSSMYLPMQLYVFIAVLVAIRIFSSIGSFLSSQFTLPIAQLAPAYKATHWQFAAVMGLGVIATGAFVLWSYNVHLVLATLWGATVLLGGLLSDLMDYTTKRALLFVRLLQSLAVTAVLFAVGYWAFLLPLYAQHILANPPWVLLVSLSVIAVYFALALIWRLQVVCRDRIEAGAVPILSFHDIQQFSEKRIYRSSQDPYQRISKCSFIIGCILLIMLAWDIEVGQPLLLLSSVIPMLVVCSIAAIGFKTWRKIPFQASMMIRPPGRRIQVKQIFISVAAEFRWTIPMVATAVLMAFKVMATVTEAPVESMIATVILTLGVLAVTYAVTMWALTVRSPLSTVLGVLATFFVCYAIVFASVVTMEFYTGGSIEGVALLVVLAVVGGLFASLAAIATFLIWRRYLKLEWGHYLR